MPFARHPRNDHAKWLICWLVYTRSLQIMEIELLLYGCAAKMAYTRYNSHTDAGFRAFRTPSVYSDDLVNGFSK